MRAGTDQRVSVTCDDTLERYCFKNTLLYGDAQHAAVDARPNGGIIPLGTDRSDAPDSK